MRWIVLFLASCLAGFGVGVAAASSPSSSEQGIPVDRIVAVVDEDPIFASDIERILGLGQVEPRGGEDEKALRRRVLETLIDQRLHLHVVGRYDFGAVPVAEIDRQVAVLEERFGGHENFVAKLAALGLDELSLRHLLRRQLRILIYIEERLGPRVFVDQEDIDDYYQNVLRPALAESGDELVPLAEVAEDIRALLREARLNDAIDAWTEELRFDAEIIDLFERPSRPLPPVVDRLPAEP